MNTARHTEQNHAHNEKEKYATDDEEPRSADTRHVVGNQSDIRQNHVFKPATSRTTRDTLNPRRCASSFTELGPHSTRYARTVLYEFNANVLEETLQCFRAHFIIP
jgi:hypothetical protein